MSQTTEANGRGSIAFSGDTSVAFMQLVRDTLNESDFIEAWFDGPNLVFTEVGGEVANVEEEP